MYESEHTHLISDASIQALVVSPSPLAVGSPCAAFSLPWFCTYSLKTARASSTFSFNLSLSSMLQLVSDMTKVEVQKKYLQ